MPGEQHQEPQNAPQGAYAPHPSRSSLGIPIAIVIAAALIAGAIIYTGSLRTGTVQVSNNDQNVQETDNFEIKPVTDKDHILGNPNAPVVVVEYSDFDCPFCKNFHETMQAIMSEYGTEGKVAWVYRHYPIQQLHPNSPQVASASECVANLGGNDAFWKFADNVFGDRSTNEPTNLTKLSEYAESAGVSRAQFTSCAEAGTYDEFVMENLSHGNHGTPYSVVVVGDQRIVINGAQPLANVRQLIGSVIAQIEGGSLE
jgi:protein-disulfide isomerase